MGRGSRFYVWGGLALTVLLVLASSWPGARAQGVATIRLVPAYQEIQPGGTADVAVRVEQVQGLYSFELRLTFDPSVLQVEDADPARPGVQVELGDWFPADIVVRNEVSNTGGLIEVAVSMQAPHAPLSGSGRIARITFRGIRQGTSPLVFFGALLADNNGMEIPSQWEEGQIVVGQAAPWTPSPSPSPTPSPTSVPPTPTPTLSAPTPTPTSPAGPTPTPSPTPSPAPSSTPEAGLIRYVVRTGDTLYSIARRFGTTVDELVRVNGLRDPSYIQIAQVLLIPAGGGTTPSTVYVVRTGDTLYSIARRFGTTVQVLAQVNHILNPDLIYIGQRLSIPSGGMPGDSRLYTVRPGDTLFAIARRYGVSPWAIAWANALPNPNLIYPGQVLRIP